MEWPKSYYPDLSHLRQGYEGFWEREGRRQCNRGSTARDATKQHGREEMVLEDIEETEGR